MGLEYDASVWVGFSTTRKWQSAVIRWITRAPASHAWISFWDETLRQRLVLEAETVGYRAILWDRWVRKNKLVKAFEAADDGLDMLEGVRWAATHLSDRYDYRSAAVVAFAKLFRRRIRSPWRSAKSLMCSEAVAKALVKGGFVFDQGIDLETISPGDLMRIVEESGQFRRVG